MAANSAAMRVRSGGPSSPAQSPPGQVRRATDTITDMDEMSISVQLYTRDRDTDEGFQPNEHGGHYYRESADLDHSTFLQALPALPEGSRRPSYSRASVDATPVPRPAGDDRLDDPISINSGRAKLSSVFAVVKKIKEENKKRGEDGYPAHLVERRVQVNNAISTIVLYLVGLATTALVLSVFVLEETWDGEGGYVADSETKDNSVLLYKWLISGLSLATLICHVILYHLYEVNRNPGAKLNPAAILLDFQLWLEIVVSCIHCPPHAEPNILNTLVLLRAYLFFKLLRFHPWVARMRHFFVSTPMGADSSAWLAMKNAFRASPWAILFMQVLVTVPSFSYAIQVLERPYDAEFNDFGTAVWYCLVSMTTVGYGDYSPQSRAGRAVGMALSCVGVALASLLLSALLQSIELNSGQAAMAQAALRKQLQAELRSNAATVIQLSYRRYRRHGEQSPKEVALLKEALAAMQKVKARIAEFEESNEGDAPDQTQVLVKEIQSVMRKVENIPRKINDVRSVLGRTEKRVRAVGTRVKQFEFAQSRVPKCLDEHDDHLNSFNDHMSTALFSNTDKLQELLYAQHDTIKMLMDGFKEAEDSKSARLQNLENRLSSVELKLAEQNEVSQTLAAQLEVMQSTLQQINNAMGGATIGSGHLKYGNIKSMKPKVQQYNRWKSGLAINTAFSREGGEAGAGPEPPPSVPDSSRSGTPRDAARSRAGSAGASKRRAFF